MGVQPGGVNSEPIQVVLGKLMAQSFPAGVAIVSGHLSSADNNKKLTAFVCSQFFSDEPVKFPQKPYINSLGYNQRAAQRNNHSIFQHYY